MSVLISGMNLPKRREEVFLFAVDSDGRVFGWRSNELPGCKAIELPPHGRLIDVDKIGLTDFEIIMCNGNYRNGLQILLDRIETTPTVIEAEN